MLRELDADLGRYEIDLEATAARAGADPQRAASGGWPKTPRRSPSASAAGELDVHDLVRQYGVILDWGTGELLPKTTEQFRAMLRRRAASHWLQA